MYNHVYNLFRSELHIYIYWTHLVNGVDVDAILHKDRSDVPDGFWKNNMLFLDV